VTFLIADGCSSVVLGSIVKPNTLIESSWRVLHELLLSSFHKSLSSRRKIALKVTCAVSRRFIRQASKIWISKNIFLDLLQIIIHLLRIKLQIKIYNPRTAYSSCRTSNHTTWSKCPPWFSITACSRASKFSTAFDNSSMEIDDTASLIFFFRSSRMTGFCW